MARSGQVASAGLEDGCCAVAGEAAWSDTAAAPAKIQHDKLGDLISEASSLASVGVPGAWCSNNKDTAPTKNWPNNALAYWLHMFGPGNAKGIVFAKGRQWRL
jgi:hypothetical protein